MRRLRVGILDLIGNRPTPGLWNRLMKPNFASIMPQVIAVWSEQMGHDVSFVCHTGTEDLARELPAELDVLFIAAFTNAAQRAAAISSQYRAGGTVTAVGGPHARSYPQDAARYFDYVLGFTNKALLDEVLRDCAPHRPLGLMLSAKKQPPQLPGVRERWKFIEPTIAKAPTLKLVPMIGSLGCPYNCSFCVDSEVEFQPLARDQIQEDLRFLVETLKRPCVAWHDPNFGIRFEETMDAIEEVVPPGAIDFAAESSLSILSEPHLRRMKKNGFKAILPGLESWYEMGGKSNTGATVGRAKVDQVSEHVNQIQRYIPYVQTNFVLGLDGDEGEGALSRPTRSSRPLARPLRSTSSCSARHGYFPSPSTSSTTTRRSTCGRGTTPGRTSTTASLTFVGTRSRRAPSHAASPRTRAGSAAV